MGSRGSEYNNGSKIGKAKDWDALQTAIKETMHSAWISPELRDNANFEAVKESMKAVDKMVKLFPFLKKSGLSLRYNDGNKKDNFINGMTQYGELYFGNEFYQKENPGINDIWEQGSFHPKNFSSQQSIAHELGHHMEAMYLRKLYHGLPIGSLFEKGAGAREIFKDIYKQMKKEGYKGTLTSLRKGISEYADYDWAEAGAEAIGDYFSNGENANPVSKRYVEELIKRLS